MMMAKNEQPYKEYIAKLDEVLHTLTSKKIRTVVVCQPGTFNSVQQYCIRQLIDTKYFDKVEYLNLNDLFDDIDVVSFDGMHLKKEGYAKVAERMKAMLFK
jgi:lysophospholipase L1-like esterase